MNACFALRRPALLLAALAAAQAVRAQETGALELRVSDRETGRPIVAATALVSGDEPRFSAEPRATDRGGVARIEALPAAGVYSVLVAADGYARVAVKDIAVSAGTTRVLRVALWRSVEESVNVVASPFVVELDEVAPMTRFGGDFLEDLPVLGREVQSMLALAPGVQDVDGDGNPNVHGARERDFKLMLGDVSNQDPLTGLYLGYINPDTIADLEVFPVGAGAEFGRAQGGFARVVQKQGGNAFEGLAGFAFRTSRLDGDGAADLPAERTPAFKTLLPFVQVSGPIVKERLWYRLSAEYRREDEPVNVTGVFAVSSRRQIIADAEMSWQVTPRTKLSTHVRHDPFTNTNLGLAATIPPESTRKLDFEGTTYSFSAASVRSPRLLLESTAAIQRYEEQISPTTRGVRNDCVVGYDFIEAAQCFSTATNRYSGSYNEDRTDVRRRLTVLGKLSYHTPRILGVAHGLRLGGAIEAERFTRATDSRPFLNFQIIRPQPIETGPGTVEVPPHFGLASASLTVPLRAERSAHGTTSSLWLEDHFRPLSNLSVTLGLRYDREEISAVGFEPFDPGEESRRWSEIATGDPALDAILIRPVFTRSESAGDIPTMLAPLVGFTPRLSGISLQTFFWDKTRRASNLELRSGVFSPRFSLSWDPSGEGKTKIAVTAGRYHDKTFLAVPLVETDPTNVSLTYRAVDFEGQWYIVDFAGTINPGLSIRQVDRGLRPPRQDEISLTFEHEIAPEVLLRVVGIARKFEDQFQDVDLNRTIADAGRCLKKERAAEHYVEASPGAGFELTDAYTGESYVDTDPGPGDGLLDDCTGSSTWAFPAWSPPILVPRPDGRPDLYLRNPAWGSVLRVGNYNRSRYHAVVLELVRRMRANWQMEASYTWSRAIGEAEDFLQTLGNDRSIVDDERGFLSYDQRHVVKVNAAAATPWGVRLGLAATWQSGLPFSNIEQTASQDSIAPTLSTLAPPDPSLRTIYGEGGRNSERNRSYWNFDVQAVREFRTRGGGSVRLTAEVFNLLNDGTYIVYSPALKYGRRFFGVDEAYRRFGRRFQLGMRVAF